jgi:hypothetical protein
VLALVAVLDGGRVRVYEPTEMEFALEQAIRLGPLIRGRRANLVSELAEVVVTR